MSYQSDVARADRITEAIDFPEVILIDNCNSCNLRCSMCDHQNIRKYRKLQLMDMGVYRKIIDEIALEKPHARVWGIFFGEPFLCRDIAERIHYAKVQGLTDVVLNSNGTLLTAEKARAVINAGLDALYVGIDAATQEVYEKIRVGGDFHTAVKNVLQYRDLLARYGKPHQQLFVQYVVSDLNAHEVERFKLFWAQEKVQVKIRPKVSWAGLVDARNLQDNQKVARTPCYWLMRNITICAHGEVALCAVDVHCRMKCGNVIDHTIKEIWQGKLRDYRRMHQEKRFAQLPAMCRKCSDWQSAYAEFVYC